MRNPNAKSRILLLTAMVLGLVDVSSLFAEEKSQKDKTVRISPQGDKILFKNSDPVHFRPKLPTKKTVGDVMPFYWKGEYHVFYLTNPMGNHDVNWEHCSSSDLVNWKWILFDFHSTGLLNGLL